MVLAVEKHELLRVDVQLGGPGYHPFLVDTGAEISLIPASLASNIKGKINRQLSRQPVMVDGSSIRCEGTVTCRIRFGPRDISAQFYIVPGITEGILGLDTLSHLDLQIDTRTRRLLIDGHAIPECEWLRPPERSRSQIQLVRFGKVYATTDEYIAPGQEYTVWGKVHCPGLRPGETYTGVVEVTERLPASHGLVGCCTLAIGGPSRHVPVKVFNLSEETVRIHKNQSLAEFTEATTSTNATTGPPDVDKITTGNHLTDEQSRRLQRLLCKYETVFAYDGNEGRTSTIEHTIKLTDDTPVASRYRRTPSGWRHEIESEVQRLRNNGVIRSSTSSYAAPICPVKKKDGTMRLCIDYRQLNARTKSDAFPTGNVLDVIDNMAGARYFSTIDLAQGYHQVPVAEADREKTAFRTSSGLWEFTRMPFGLKGAPATFCRLMAHVLGHMSPTQLALYMDDICVISATFDSHLERLEATFKNLLAHGLRIKAHKCSFAMAEVIFCGHKLSAEGIQPSSTKLDAISRLPVPSTPTEVKTFLGATGWYRKFIRNYATTATPLTKLTHAGVAFNWTHECQTAFETLKLQLMKSPLLSHIRPVGTLILTTDASTVGLGAELAQETHEGTHPVAFFLAKL